MTLLAAALALGLAGQAAQPPVFRVGVEAVYVDVFVTEAGRPVAGLEASDFELRDDGRRHRVELVAVESLPLRTLLLLDTSGSVHGLKLERLEQGALTLLRGLRPGDEGALVTFDHEIAVRVAPTTELARVEAALGRLGARGATALYDALYVGTLLAGGAGRSLLVAFSDGEDNLSWLDARKLHGVLEQSNVLLQVIASLPPPPPIAPGPGRGTVVEPPEPAHVRTLRGLAEVTGGRLWSAGSPDRLAQAFQEVLETMRTRYVLRFEPLAPQKPGLHEIDVRLTRRSGKVHCRRAYFVGPAAR